MTLILLMAAVLWGLGAMMGAPHRARWAMIGVLYLAVLALHLVLPADYPLPVATGGSFGEWLLLGAAGVVIAGYRRGLRRLRRMAGARQVSADDKTAKPKSGSFSGAELERYARHIVLPDLGGPGQQKLARARVLIVGAGGLGSPVALYLAAAGVGRIGLIDDDIVSLSNLQRQILHTDDRIDMPKVFSAKIALAARNPHVDIRPYHRRLGADMARDLFDDYDLIVDGSDNFDTRYLVNAAAHRAGKPLMFGAISRWDGQLSLFDTAHGTPCYQCVFPQAPAPGQAPPCAEAGVIGALPGVVGSIMAMEVLKHLAGAGDTLAGRLLLYDALRAEMRQVRLSARPDCPVCGTSADAAGAGGAHLDVPGDAQ